MNGLGTIRYQNDRAVYEARKARWAAELAQANTDYPIGTPIITSGRDVVEGYGTVTGLAKINLLGEVLIITSNGCAYRYEVRKADPAV